jgi:hypothetical protein
MCDILHLSIDNAIYRIIFALNYKQDYKLTKMIEVEDKIKIDLKWVKKGDLQKLADELGVSRQHLYDVSAGRVTNKEIETALILLNAEREKKSVEKSTKAVKNIITE